MNGILNTEAMANENIDWMESSFHINVGLIYNKCLPCGLDVLRGAYNRILLEKLPNFRLMFLSRSARNFLKEFLAFCKTARPSDRFYALGHSDGLHHIKLAVRYLNTFFPGLTKQLRIIGISTADYVSKTECDSVMYLVPRGDIIAHSNRSFFMALAEGTITFLPGNHHKLQNKENLQALKKVFEDIHEEFNVR